MAGRPVSVHEANTAAAVWRAEVNAAVHSEICAVPDARLLTEREVLRPLPSLRLEIGPPPVTRKVDRLSCVRFASARYSVPTRLIGTTVRLVQNGGRLLIAEPTGEVVADHPLTAPGEAVVLDEHYDGPRPAPARGPAPENRHRETVLRARPGRGGVPGRRRRDRQHPAGRRTGRAAGVGCGARHRRRWSTRWPGRSRSNGSAPPTSGPSWPPAPAHRPRSPPVGPWSSTCRSRRPGRWPPTASTAITGTDQPAPQTADTATGVNP